MRPSLKKEKRTRLQMTNSSSRGDLGFIPNNRSMAPNRLFFGSPGHPSKKGVAALSQTSKLNVVEDAKGDLAPDDLITKRTDYLETQERRLTATVSETKSETNRLNDLLNENKDSQKVVVANMNKMKQNLRKLFDQMQTVYGKVGDELFGITCDEADIDDTLNMYRKHELNVTPLNNSGAWILLTYPMEEVSLSDTHKQCFMKCKTANKETGQLCFHWVVIFEERDGKEIKYISEFSLLPK